jgi:hypothetical protein
MNERTALQQAFLRGYKRGLRVALDELQSLAREIDRSIRSPAELDQYKRAVGVERHEGERLH